jgi:hypothetical protein
MTQRSQGTSTPVRSWRWRWVGPALLVLSVIVNLMNPHLTPGLHMIWWFVMLPLTISVLGYTLYAQYRERRRRRDASNGT